VEKIKALHHLRMLNQMRIDAMRFKRGARATVRTFSDELHRFFVRTSY